MEQKKQIEKLNIAVYGEYECANLFLNSIIGQPEFCTSENLETKTFTGTNKTIYNKFTRYSGIMKKPTNDYDFIIVVGSYFELIQSYKMVNNFIKITKTKTFFVIHNWRADYDEKIIIKKKHKFAFDYFKYNSYAKIKSLSRKKYNLFPQNIKNICEFEGKKDFDFDRFEFNMQLIFSRKNYWFDIPSFLNWVDNEADGLLYDIIDFLEKIIHSIYDSYKELYN